MPWVGTGGGPFIVIPWTIARRWRGANSYTQRAKTDPRLLSWFNSPQVDDYDRACSIQAHAAILKVGRGHGLVLQTEAEPVTWIANDDSGVIVQVCYSDLDEAGIRDRTLTTPEGLWQHTGHRLRVSRGGLLIFDSVYAGDALPNSPGQGANVPWMRLRLESGIYRIRSAAYEPDPGSLLRLYRLERDDSIALAR